MKLALAVVTGFCLLLPGQLHAQGCLGGDSDEEGMQIAGFFQPEFGYQFGEEEDMNSFSLRRARVAMFGNIPYDINYYLCLEFSQFILAEDQENTGVLDAFITYSRFGPYAKLTLGQYKAPFSLEQNTSCSGLYTIKRSTVVNNLAGPQRDIGLMVSGSHDDLVKYSLAFMNGTGIATKDNNKAKDIVGRVVVSPMQCLSVGGSYRFGKSPPLDPGAVDEDERTRFGAEIEFTYADLLVQGEFIQGEDVGSYFEAGG
jgi:phosphate-selective porin